MAKEKVKKPFYKKWWVWLLAVIIIGSIATSGEEDSAEPTSADPASEVKADDSAKEEPNKDESKEDAKKAFGIGEEVKVKNLAYTVNGVEEQTELKMEYMDPLTTEGKFLIIDMTVKNSDKKARLIDGEMLRLVDSDGTEYSSNFEADMYINDGDVGFFLQEVNPNLSKSGKVAFEVPANADNLQLQVSSGLGWSGGKYEVINLK